MSSWLFTLLFVALLHQTCGSESDSDPMDLKMVYDQAEADLTQKQMEEFDSGATSKRFHRKRENAFTRDMSKRNRLYRQMRSNLEIQGMSSERSRKLAKRSIDEWYTVKNSQTEAGHVFKIKKQCGSEDGSTMCNTEYKFRSLNGVCNNLQKPSYGSAGIAFPRYRKTSPFRISDPIKEITFPQSLPYPSNAASKNGCHLRKNLPNARLVSHIVHTDRDAPSNLATHFTTQFGQFVDHDITLTPEEESENCCEEKATIDEKCLAINVTHDAFFQAQNISCLSLTRSTPFCPENEGKARYRRNQMNAITSFVDGSNIYGSDLERGHELRTFTMGELRAGAEEESASGVERNPRFFPALLPRISRNEEGIQTEAEFEAGDIRAREIPRLAMTHNLWVREHNRVAKLVSMIDENLDDEEVYQYARRVVVAEYQNVVYGQFMSEILGTDDLKPRRWGSTYKPNVDPAMRNEIATAVFRFGHSMVQGMTTLLAVDNATEEVGFFRLRDVFFDDGFYINATENLLMELLFRPAQSNDASVSEELTNHLFANFMTAGDLVSRNLQRGRDHGLPGFCCFYRRFQAKGFDCTKGWEVQYEGIPDDVWAKLQQVYNHPSDIDLFTGGIAQLSGGKGQLGGVFHAMIKDQFRRTMKGDRFFFNHKNCNALNGVGFTKRARQMLRDRTMAGVICDVTSLTKVPSNAFRMNSEVIDCSQPAKIGRREIKELMKFQECAK